jgi:hypothetical protein
MDIAFTFFGLFENVYVFLTIMILLGGLIGMASTKLSIAGYGAFLIFSHIAVESDLVFFNNLLYVVLIFLVILIGFNSWQFFTGSGTAA